MVGVGKRFGYGVLVATSGLLLAACGSLRSAAPAANGTPSTPAAISTAATSGGAAAEATTPRSLSTGGAGTTAAEHPAPTQGGPIRCSAGVLRGRVEPGEPGAGQRYARLVVTNAGGAACTLYGYGGLQLVDGSGRPVPTDLRRNEQPGPAMVRLAPGQSAAKNLHWTVVPGSGESDTGPCEPAAATISVIPPDETQPLRTAWNFGEVCGHGQIDGSAYYAN
jgi:hypothetical protein